MSETYDQLKHKIEILRARENLNNLKSIQNMSTTTKPKFLTNQDAQKRIAALENENTSLRTSLASAKAAAPARTASTAPSATAPKATGWTARTVPTMSRAEFSNLTARDKMDFSKAGGKITN